jgi:flagellar biosynthesis/type III secretory pathway protein FliH
LSEDERARLLAESREKGRRDFEARMKDAITTGLEKGRQEGELKGQAAVLALMKEGLSPAEIEARLGMR